METVDSLREKVIQGLECCSKNAPYCSNECPYYSEEDCWQLERDALELLKEQEQKLVDNIKFSVIDTTGDCPNCTILLHKRYNPLHCGLCGQAVKWD